MEIEIIPKSGGGTEFLAQPYRLHLGGRQAEGVDTLHFSLPDAWAALSVSLYIEHCDGTSASPIVLDSTRTVTVGRSFTGWPSGRWMLAATDGEGYTAYTRPGTYDVYDVLPTDGTEDTPDPTQYEQFVAQVLESANRAASLAKSAEASAEAAQQAAEAVDKALASVVSSASDLFSVEGEAANAKLWNAVNAGGRYSGGNKTLTLVYSDCTAPATGAGAARYYIAYRDTYPEMDDAEQETLIRDTVFAAEGSEPVLVQFLYKSGTLTFENCTFHNVLFWFGRDWTHKFTFRNCRIEDNEYNFIQCGEWNANAEYLIEGCTFRHMRPNLAEYRADVVPLKLNGWAHGNIRCLGYDLTWTIRDTLFEDCMGKLNLFFGKSSHIESTDASRVRLYMERCTIRQTNGAGITFSAQPVTGWIRDCSFSDIGANRCNSEGYDLPADYAVHSGSGTEDDPYVYACGVGGNAIFSYNSTPRHELVISGCHMARMMENGVEGNYREVSFNHIEETGYRVSEGIYTPSTEGIYGNICVCKGNVVRNPGAEKAAIVIPRGYSDGQACFYEDNLLEFDRDGEENTGSGFLLSVSSETLGYALSLKSNTIRGFAKKFDFLNAQQAELTGVRVLDTGEDDDVMARADFYQNSLLGVHYETAQGKSIVRDDDFSETDADGALTEWSVLYGTGKVYTNSSCERFLRIIGNSRQSCALLAQDFRLGPDVYLARVRCSVRSSTGMVGFAPLSVDGTGAIVANQGNLVFNPQMAVLNAAGDADANAFHEVTHTMAVTQNCRICILNPGFDDSDDAELLSQLDVKNVEIMLMRCQRGPESTGEAEEAGTLYDFANMTSSYPPAGALRVSYYIPDKDTAYTGIWNDAMWMMGKYTGGDKGRGRVLLNGDAKHYSALPVWYASDFNLELNGCTLECANTDQYGYLQLFNGANVTIKGPGTITAQNCALTLAEGCSCTLEDGVTLSTAGSWAAVLSAGSAEARTSLTAHSAAIGNTLAEPYTTLTLDVPDADSSVTLTKLQTNGTVVIAKDTKAVNNGTELTTAKLATALFYGTNVVCSYSQGHTDADLSVTGDESSVDYSYLDANSLLVSKTGALSAAFSAAASTRTTRTGAMYLKLNSDISTYSGFYVQNVGEIELNLNGHSISTEHQSYALYFANNCAVTIDDESDRGEGGGEIAGSVYTALIANGEATTLTLSGGTIRESTNHCIHAENGAQVTLTGTAKLVGKNGVDLGTGSSLVISGGTIEATSKCVQAMPSSGTATVTVHSGTLTSDDLSFYAQSLTLEAVQGATATITGRLDLSENAVIGENTRVTLDGEAVNELKKQTGTLVVSYEEASA